MCHSLNMRLPYPIDVDNWPNAMVFINCHGVIRALGSKDK